MSKQPQIRIVYPNASAAAMLLTDAMIKRTSGKRVVTTDSEEREYTGEALFGALLACKMDTSVELTLNLNPDAMDYALTTLIAKNLTEDEKRQVRMETDSMEIMDLLSTAQAAADASTCTEEVRSASRADDAIEVPPLEAPADKAERGDIERIILECLNDHLPDADYLTKTGIMSDLARRLNLHIELQTKKHKLGWLSSVDLRMILHNLVEELGGSCAPGVVVSHIDAAVEEIDRESRSIEIEEEEDMTAYTAGIGFAIYCMTLLKDSKKDKTIHALYLLGKYLEEYIKQDLILEGYQIEKAFDEAGTLIDEVPLASADIMGLVGEVRKYIAGEKESGLHVPSVNEEGEATDGEFDPGLLNDIDDDGEETEAEK